MMDLAIQSAAPARRRRRVLGTITLGQAPREDLTPRLRAALPANVELIQFGVVDGMGFVERHRAAAQAVSGLPVVLSSALIAKLVAEVV